MFPDDQIHTGSHIDMRDNKALLLEVKNTAGLILPGFDFTRFNAAFADVERLFAGLYPGYRACNTAYHDFRHTLQVLLAMTRLMHGASVEGVGFTDREINLGLISALMHDTGYIQKLEDKAGTGAKYTLTHISRGIRFVENYYAGDDYFEPEMKNFHDILSCTGIHTMVAETEFASKKAALLGRMLGTADLLGQMADRLYLEKLVILYNEFEEGAVPGFNSEADLYRKTVSFYRRTKARFKNEFGNVNRFMISHFRKRWNIDANLYEEAIEKNIYYLKYVLKAGQKDIYHCLRRNAISLQ